MQNLIEAIQNSGLFDGDWYLEQYPDVQKSNLSALEHFLGYGWQMGRNPSEHFDTSFYLKSNNDVQNFKINPLIHFIQNGRKEGRKIKASRDLAENSPLKNELNNLHKDYAIKIKKDELGYLLNYATLLKKSGCLESYTGIIKYLVLHYEQFIERLQKVLLSHLRNVILLTEDSELTDFLKENRLDLLLNLNLPKSKLIKIIDLPSISNSYKDIDNNCIYDQQNSDDLIDLLIQKPDLLASNHELNMLFANAFARQKNSKSYENIIKNYLQKEKCNCSVRVKGFENNVLKNISIISHNEVWVDHGLISIIMSAYNSESTVEYAIRSLLQQTYKNIEILVCDDNSNDRTLDIVKNLANQDKRIRVFSSNNNQGTYNIRNHMVEKAEGKYITFQDSDDYALPTRLQKQVEEITTKNATICFTRWIRVTPDGQFVFFIDGILKRFCVVSAMVKSEYIKSIAKFRSSLVAADTEFYEYCKNSLPASQIVHVDTTLILGLWSSSSLTKMSNLNAEHSGYVAPRRILYSEISGKQRLLGQSIITDKIVEDKLKELNIYMNKTMIKEY